MWCSTVIARVLGLVLCTAACVLGSNVAQDVRDLSALQSWKVSAANTTDAPSQACGIANLNSYSRERLDFELPYQVSDADANASIDALDKKITTLLGSRRWWPMKIAGSGGIPDLTRCYQKQGAVTQIYKTTGRCTMGSPCTVFDGFTVVFYLPKKANTPKENSGQ